MSCPCSTFTSPAGGWACPQCDAAVRWHRGNGQLPVFLTGMTNSLLPCMLAVLISQHHALTTASHFTGPPTPWLPLDVYTDPFIEDSLGLLSLCMCVCLCAHNSPGPQHSLSALSPVEQQCRVCSSRPQSNTECQGRGKHDQGQVVIQAPATLMWARIAKSKDKSLLICD